VDEAAAFLRAHPPFDALSDGELALLAEAAELLSFAAGETIFAQGTGPQRAVWAVRTGAVELVDRGRVLDLLTPGELFGHPSMLAELPTGLEARAQGETTCYRLPAGVSRPLLARPEGLRHTARTLLARPTPARVRADDSGGPERPVGTLLRAPPVVCAPDAPIREAARRMNEGGQRCAVVRLPDGGLGILTDGDLRRRVVGGDVPPDAPVAAAMTAPAHTVGEHRLGADVLVEMLDRAIRHLPVLAADGRLLGVIDDVDLLAAERRTPFQLRTAIARAADGDALALAASELWPTVAALHDARVGPEHVGAIISVVADALVRRLLDLAVAAAGEPPAPFAWLALGSLARREGVPSSDVDCAIAWDGDDDPAVGAYVRGVARAVLDGLERCGLPSDDKGATADKPLFARAVRAWDAALDSWFADPTQEKALILVSLVGDGRAVWGERHAAPLAARIRAAREHPGLLRLLARFALSHRPPTGFLRDLVVEHSGERKGRLDLKHGGLIPIVDLARWAAFKAGAAEIATPARLRAARAAGVLSDDDGRMLQEAFTLVSALRLEHQVQQLRAGEPPDNHLRPDDLSPLTRSYLKDAFRAVAAVQRRVGAELSLGVV
jgi:CBS domain-containing protein